MPAKIARSNESSGPAGQAGRLPYFLLHTYGLVSQLYRPLQLRAAPRGIHDLLPDAADAEADRAFGWFALLQTMNEILNRVLMRRLGRRRGNPMGGRLPARLHGDKIVVIVVADRAVGAGDDKAALGLRLRGPRVREGAPAGLELRQSMRVAGHHDAVLIHLESLWGVHRRGHFNGPASALIPGAERGAVAKIIEQRTAAARLLVKP